MLILWARLLPCSCPLFLLHPLALPAHFKVEMKEEEATEGGTATLHCELTKAAAVEWKKKHKVLKPGDKYTMRQEGATAELVIHDLEVKDSGDYTCVCGDKKTTAALTVHGKKNATFRCVLVLPSPLDASVLTSP